MPGNNYRDYIVCFWEEFTGEKSPTVLYETAPLPCIPGKWTFL
jgi:hypothetical protein